MSRPLFSRRVSRCLSFFQLFFWPTIVVVLAGNTGIRINTTASVPVGLYRITSDPDAPFVELCPPGPLGPISVERGYRRSSAFGNCPDGGEPLVKEVIARTGDLVQTSEKGIRVNDKWIPNTAPAVHDSDGRPLDVWPFGRYRVSAGMVWVASSSNLKSFDSRYFGPLSVTTIRHYLVPFWTIKR